MNNERHLAGNTTGATGRSSQVVASVPTSAVIGSGFTRLIIADDGTAP
ncbi:hypothetical protein AB0M44_26285 [Streptosporangium subroseum]